MPGGTYPTSATSWPGSRGDRGLRAVEARALRQSRFIPLVEAVANVIVGYGAAVLTQVMSFPVMGLTVTIF